MCVLKITDNVITALEAMVNVDCSRAWVSSLEGEVLGCVSLQDICKQLILQESQFRFGHIEKQSKDEIS